LIQQMDNVDSMNMEMEKILLHLEKERGLDFRGYRSSMIARRISQRVSATACRDLVSYLSYLREHPAELDDLVDALTINVSRFFRNPLMFEYVASEILPRALQEQHERGENSFRVWSAGCSFGEEAYSAAILIHEILEREDLPMDVHIFATDIDQNALIRAGNAVYPFEAIKDVKYGLLKRYFTPVRGDEWKTSNTGEDAFQLKQEIRDAVSFSPYDMLHRNTFAPPESVFGSFDMVFCRNLLIYFNLEYQDAILEKLYRSLSPKGYLILGETEVPTSRYQRYFVKVNACCHVYQKA